MDRLADEAGAGDRAVGPRLDRGQLQHDAVTAGDLALAYRRLNAAYLAGGSYNSIDHNQRIEYVAAPQDPDILRLNTDLNETYVYYGASGAANFARQQAQDASNIEASREAGIQRAASKASAYYCNEHWDLLDACRSPDGEPPHIGTAEEHGPRAQRDGLQRVRAGADAAVEQDRYLPVDRIHHPRQLAEGSLHGPETPGTECCLFHWKTPPT